MSIKKRLLNIALASTVVLTLAACGTSESNGEPNQELGGGQKEPDTTSGNQGIYEGELTTNLVTDTTGKYILSVQNNKENEVTLTFPSSQQFDYTISNQEGEVLYTYSMDKSFMQVVSEKTLIAGENIEIDVDITEYFPKLEAGTYSLDVWVTANSEEDLSASVSFTLDEGDVEFGEGSQGSQGELPGLVSSEVVEFVGLADNHSVEVINDKEEFEVVQVLEETVKSEFEKLSNGDRITINYTMNEHDQKVVESVIKE